MEAEILLRRLPLAGGYEPFRLGPETAAAYTVSIDTHPRGKYRAVVMGLFLSRKALV